MYFSRVDHIGILQVFSLQLVSCFLLGSVISRSEPVWNSSRDRQDVCPGYDGNEDAPIGCFIMNDGLLDEGMIHK